MTKISDNLVASVLGKDIRQFQLLLDSATDKQMIEALSDLWASHRQDLEEDSRSFELFLEMFNYQYNKFLIRRPSLQEAKIPEAKASSNNTPLSPSIIKEIFKSVRERKVLAY